MKKIATAPTSNTVYWATCVAVAPAYPARESAKKWNKDYEVECDFGIDGEGPSGERDGRLDQG